ncbi:MAG: hypothetical protein EKK65_11335 [Lysobacterales bacterium]|nr:MAG: hypothetical protein EKK65_11335 [Xanthomonadales bacterium]
MNDRRPPDDDPLLQRLGEQLERRGVHAGTETARALLERASAELRRGADLDQLAARLAEQACAAARRVSSSAAQPVERLIAVGASTGGPDAIRTFLRGLNRRSPGVVIAQHMPAGFTRLFAERLTQTTGLEVIEAAGNESILPGHVYIAPGHAHLTVRRAGSHFLTRLSDAPPVNDVRPSVDVLFESLAGCAGEHVTGVLLTGMGRDGAQGLLAMRRAGARTFAQNEATCTVYGMPRAAVRIGAAETVLPIERLAAAVLGEGAGGISPFEASPRSAVATSSFRAAVPAFGCV